MGYMITTQGILMGCNHDGKRNVNRDINIMGCIISKGDTGRNWDLLFSTNPPNNGFFHWEHQPISAASADLFLGRNTNKLSLSGDIVRYMIFTGNTFFLHNCRCIIYIYIIYIHIIYIYN